MLGEDVKTLDGAGIIDQVADPPQAFVGFGDQGAALALLGADVHQPDAGALYPQHHAAVVAAENRVVNQMLGLGLWVGPGIDEDKMSALARADDG